MEHKRICNFEKSQKSQKIASDSNICVTEYKDQINKLTDVVLDVVKKNNELTNQIIELSSKSNMNISNNTNNINNKTFNLHFFLNEECKNALNITEFVDSIQLQLSDLENTGRVGYVEGISNIFIKNLEDVTTHDRLIHCSDFKREIFYIKDNNEWIKEDELKPTLQKAIKKITNKNINQISLWKKENPDYFDSDSKINDLYLKIMYNSICGSTEEEENKNINKIIKNVAKKVVIKK